VFGYSGFVMVQFGSSVVGTYTEHGFEYFDYEPTLSGAIIFTILFIILALMSIYEVVRLGISNEVVNEHDLDGFNIEYERPVYYDSSTYSRGFIYPLKYDDYTERTPTKQLQCKMDIKSLVVLMYIPLICGLLLEVTGYISRIFLHYNSTLYTPFYVQYFSILLGPIFISSAIYVSFGILMVLLDAKRYSVIPLSCFIFVFFSGDVIMTVLELAGAGILAVDLKYREGNITVLVGLILQLFFLVLFLINNVRFTILMKRNPTQFSQIMNQLSSNGSIWDPRKQKSWSIINIVSITATSLMIVRTGVRISEMAEGFFRFIYNNEYFLYVFDTLLIFIASFMLILARSGKWLVRMHTYKKILEEKTTMELKKRKKHKKRSKGKTNRRH